MAQPLAPPSLPAEDEPPASYYLLDCSSCGKPTQHRLLGLSAEYPLCLLWDLTCTGCGQQVEAWEDRQVPIRYGGGDPLPLPLDELDQQYMAAELSWLAVDEEIELEDQDQENTEEVDEQVPVLS